MSYARKSRIIERASDVPETAVASEIAEAIHRLADVGELIAGGLFALAAGVHTDNTSAQRSMTAVFKEDAATRYADVWKKLEEKQRRDLERFIDGICKGKR